METFIKVYFGVTGIGKESIGWTLVIEKQFGWKGNYDKEDNKVEYWSQESTIIN